MIRWSGYLTVACLLLLGTVASAQPGALPRQVRVQAAGPALQVQGLEAVMRELLGRLGVELGWSSVDRVNLREVLAPPENTESPFARVWIDATRPDVAWIYLTDRGSERFLVRQVVTTGAIDEVTREAIGHIVESAIDALLQGRQIGVSRAQAHVALGVPAPPRTAAARPLRPSRQPAPLAVDVGAFYQVQQYSPTVPVVHGPGVITALGAGRGQVRPIGWLTAQYELPIAVAHDPIGVRLDTVALRAAGGVKLSLRSGLWLRTGLGGGVDLVYIQPRLAPGANAMLAMSRLTAVPTLYASIGIEVRLWSALSLLIGAACEVDPRPIHYDLTRNDTLETVLVRGTVRPAASIGLVVPLGGVPTSPPPRPP
jgi:hypothetical protein